MSDFNLYQWKTHETAIFPKDRALEYLGLGLASEAGEVAGKIKKVLRDNAGVLTPEKSDEIADELGDVLWYLAQAGSVIGWDLHDIAMRNQRKLQSRSARGTLVGSGDTR